MSDPDIKVHEKWMKEALRLANAALAQGEFPVGCVLVSQNQEVGKGSRTNSGGMAQNELDHAEILALRDWVKRGKPGHCITVYSTLEPCLMCTGALLINGINNIVFAYEDVMGGACGIKLGAISASGQTLRDYSMYRKLKVTSGVLRHESLRLFKGFFSQPNNNYLKGTPLEQYTLEAYKHEKQKHRQNH